MTNHAVPGGHGIRVSRGKVAPHIWFEVVYETVHYRDQMEGGAVELSGRIVLASSLDLVARSRRPSTLYSWRLQESQIVLIAIDLNESLLSFFAGGRMLEDRLHR